jgi:hypothetical protein
MSPAVWTSSCSSLEKPAAIAISQVERVHDRAQDADLQARELLRPSAQLLAASRELLRALLGEEELSEQVLEREEDEPEQGDRGDPHLAVQVGDPDREQRRRELGGQHGDHELAHEVEQRHTLLEVDPVRRDDQEVDREREHERGEHEEVEAAVLTCHPQRVPRGVEREATEEREPGVSDEVVQQEVRFVAPAKPAERHRGDSDHGRGRAAQEDHREHQREEAARDLDARGGVGRSDVAADGEHQQDREESKVPVGVADHADRGRAREREQLQSDDKTGWLDRQRRTSEEAV